MNEKTGKMLSRYARRANRPLKDLKRWWESLNWRQRGPERQRIRKELAG